MTVDTIRVWLVDDHPLVIEGIRLTLAGEPAIHIEFTAGSAAMLFDRLGRSQPDIILLDISLPDGNGIEMTRHIGERYPRVCVIILTASLQESDIREAFHAGARGYLPKNVGSDELIRAVHEVFQGGEYISEQISHHIIRSFIREAKSGKPSQARDAFGLTARETEIIRFMAEGSGYKEIADRLCISVRTVESHRNNIMEKLGLQSLAELIRFAIRNGMVRL